MTLKAIAERVMTDYNLPSMAIAYCKEGKLVEVSVSGLRRLNEVGSLAIQDRFYIGSCTKAITSTLAAILIDDGMLSWDTKISDVFPDIDAESQFGVINISQLLTHCAGLANRVHDVANLPDTLFATPGDLVSARTKLIGVMARHSLRFAPGTSQAYSDIGYIIAGAMLERCAGRDWERLVVERVFDPLGLVAAGFGQTASLGKVDGPYGHRRGANSIEVVLPGYNSEWPLYVGPAGSVHMSIVDFARWGGWHAQGRQRAPALMADAGFEKLHTPPDARPFSDEKPPRPPYAYGWGIRKFDFIDNLVSVNAGTNGHHFALLLVDRSSEVSIAIATNVGSSCDLPEIRYRGADAADSRTRQSLDKALRLACRYIAAGG